MADIARLRGARRRPDGAVAVRRGGRAGRARAGRPRSPRRDGRGGTAARAPGSTVPAAPLVIESDPRRLERIVGNLLDNAREHAPGASVDVAVAMADGAAVVVVADDGPGVPPDGSSGSSSGSTRRTRRDTAAAAGWAWRSPRSTRACCAGSLVALERRGRRAAVELRLPVTESLRDGDPTAMGGADDDAPSTAQEPSA